MSSKRPHVLYVAWGFPPCRSGGVYRALATANALAETCDVTVLTVDRDAFIRYTGVDASLEAEVDPSIDVQRTPFHWPGLDSDIRTFSRFRVFLPRIWRRWRVWNDRRRFPEAAYGPWRTDLERAAQDIHARKPVDLVVATANPATAFTAAYALHRVGVPYVLDYRDAWSLDVFSGRRVHGPRSRVGRWERRLIDGAHEVWFVNAPIRDWHRAAYPAAAARMHVVDNGWDPNFAPMLPREPSRPPLTFGYLGTISPKVPLEEFIAGWREARRKDPTIAGARADLRGYLGYYATPKPELADLVASASDSAITYGGAAPKAALREVYEGFDVLLLILGTGRYVTSGKVYEYMATGLPIVSVHDPVNAASDVLRAYPLWFPSRSLEAPDIAEALIAAAHRAEELVTSDVEGARAFAAEFRRDRVLRPRLDALLGSLATSNRVSA